MRKLFAVVLGALALFAFSAFAAPDAAKVKFGIYVPSGTVAYSVPSASPPLTAQSAESLTTINLQKTYTMIGAGASEAMASTDAAPIAHTSMIAGQGNGPPEVNLRM